MGSPRVQVCQVVKRKPFSQQRLQRSWQDLTAFQLLKRGSLLPNNRAVDFFQDLERLLKSPTAAVRVVSRSSHLLQDFWQQILGLAFGTRRNGSLTSEFGDLRSEVPLPKDIEQLCDIFR